MKIVVTSYDLINAFHHADYSFLAGCVGRDDVEMSAKTRRRLADMIFALLIGRWKRDAKRPRTYASEIKETTIIYNVRRLVREAWKKDAAIKQAAEWCSCSIGWVKQVLRAHSNLEAKKRELLTGLIDDDAFTWKLVREFRCDDKFPDDPNDPEFIEAMAWLIFVRGIEAEPK